MKTQYVLVALALLAAPIANAQQVVNTSTQESTAKAPSMPWAFNWKLNVDGSNFSHLDGQKGEGAGLNAKNSLRFGYKLPNNFAAEITPIFTYRSENPKRAGFSQFQDPYIALKKNDIFNSKALGYDLYAEARYYVPVSAETKHEIGTPKDKGNGQAMGRLIFTQAMFDGRLKNLAEYDYRRNFAEKKVAGKAIDETHEFYNILYVPVNDKLSPYVSYKSFVNRYNSGKGDPWVKNHTVGVGAKWQAMKELSVEPFMDSPFMLKDTTVKLEAVLVFI